AKMLSLNYLPIAVFVFAICESHQLKEVTVESLDCQENICRGLSLPNISDVGVLLEKATEGLTGYESLILHTSYLANLPRNVFHNLPQLAELNVLECAVQRIERTCFEGSKNLKRLNLGGNSLNSLDSNVFELATELEELNLSDNQLVEVPSRVFLPLKKLKKINLSSNQLKSIASNSFSQLANLKSVNLDGNQLKKISGEIFKDQRKQLTDFSIRNNQIELLPSNVLISVETLLLSGNIPLKRLQLTANIVQLQATHCGLESVNLDGRVVSVQLGDNLLLKELKIAQPQDLEQLYLGNTNITRLDFLSKATKLVDLDVTGIENLSDLPQIVMERGLERLSFSTDNMDMLKELNYLEISQDRAKEVFVKDLEEDFFVDHAEINCGQLADLLEFVDLPKDTTILEDRVVGDPRGPMRCGAA
ncbi:hypothetical protein KR018_004853, partial [Drosophila ironensis]